jgi:hypothetical protein
MKLSRKVIGGATRVCIIGALAVGLGGWDDNDYPVEFVTRQAGDAVNVNKATQTITPWPHYVKNRTLNLDGHRGSLAMERYQTNQVIQPSSLNPQMAKEQQSQGASPPPAQTQK